MQQAQMRVEKLEKIITRDTFNSKILKSINKNKNKVYVYGNNYKTKDGTCVRDYVHVNDIVRAIIMD